MDRKALVVALLLSALGGGCLLLYMKRFEAETSGGAKVAVLIATRDIHMGETVERGMLGVRKLPQAYIEQRHIPLDEMSNVLGAQLSMTVRANEAILWTDLASMQAERRDLSGLIEPGMRAFTIAASGSGLFGGLLRPGDRVDILHTPMQGNQLGPITITLLQNVVVLAVGSDTGAGEAGGRGSNVTVSVTPEQAQLIIHAQIQGALDVVLRNPEDIVVLKDLPEVGSADIREPERRARFVRRPAPVAQAQVGGQREIDRVR